MIWLHTDRGFLGTERGDQCVTSFNLQKTRLDKTIT
eukprot:CAMPEP_0197393124 /NCGR_PEP_ID=MMETSP1165-20131217/4138_1 /TAXON_ID=284809 /ORGANISM="Chrysocystis fragilis, Strain CCMP3189" /LENGTH=35 /DNA_ID= /DNA_START= /DNA_END= /DNA_ORIENTATION=